MKVLIPFIILFSISNLSFSGTFKDDFEDGDSVGWKEISGEWKVENGAYVQFGKPPGGGGLANTFYTLLQSPWNLGNGTIEFTFRYDIRTNENEQVISLFRMADENGYALEITKAGLTVYKIAGGSFASIRMEPSEVKPTKDKIKIMLDGMWIWVYLNDVLRMRVGDADFEKTRFKEGKVGFGVTAAEFPVYFEEISIEGDTVYQIPIKQPVNPAGKLSITWGLIKTL